MTERFTITLDELDRGCFNEKGLYVESDLVAKLRGRCIVTNGCFDILHPGHLSLLATLDTIAYKQCLRPIVALNSDVSVRKLKGEQRPAVPQASRAALLNALKWPFTVILYDEETPRRLMDLLQPVAVLKGAEYPASSVVRWSGSQVISVDMVPNWSTTGILGDTR